MTNVKEVVWNENHVKNLIDQVKKQNGKCHLCNGNILLGNGFVKYGFMFECNKKGIFISHIAHAGCCRGIMYRDLPELWHRKFKEKLFKLLKMMEENLNEVYGF